MIIDELRIIQKEHGYLPAEQLRALSERMSTPLYQIHGVASFFPHFRLQPPPKVDLGICADMACHLRGAPELVRWTTERQDALGARGVAVRSTSCLGQCDRAPAAVLNETIVGGVALEALSALIDAEMAGSIPLPPREPSPPLRIDPYAGTRTYGALQAARAAGDPGKLLDALKSSQLRGLGGAGFGTATKWEIVRDAHGDEKYVVCNADESEPGTIKDRFILDHAPHLVIEGMLLAALVTGARTGIIYIRHEYHHQKESLDHEIERCRQAGLLDQGAGIPFDLTVFVSPGGYICGEESALLEALEGRRAEPRNKPPFPGTHGLWGKPTLINNVETLAMVPVILSKGPAWFRDQGSAGASGLKFVGISGHVARPGVYEIGMGTPAREVLRARGRRPARSASQGLGTVGAIVGIPSRVHHRHPPRLQGPGRRGFHARLGGPGDLRGRHLHARHGCQRGAVLQERVVRQMCPLPDRLGQDAGPAGRDDPRSRPRGRISTSSRASRTR